MESIITIKFTKNGRTFTLTGPNPHDVDGMVGDFARTILGVDPDDIRIEGCVLDIDWGPDGPWTAYGLPPTMTFKTPLTGQKN